MKGAAVVVVSRQHVQRSLQRREQLAHQFVFLIRCVICDVSGHEQRIGLRADGTEGLDRGGEPGHRLVVEPLGAHVGITELR